MADKTPTHSRGGSSSESPCVLTRRYFHSSEAEFEPGDVIYPASEGYGGGWSENMPGYDPNYVYVFDQRHWLSQDSDPVYPNTFRHTYEVEPLGPLEQDPEGEELRKLYEHNHGHPWSGDSYDFQPGCKRCEYEDQQGVIGPEWYHPYNWRTTHVRVIGPHDWDDPTFHPSPSDAQPEIKEIEGR